MSAHEAGSTGLLSRLQAVAPLLTGDSENTARPATQTGTFELLDALCLEVGQDADLARAWLLTVAVGGALPEPELVRAVHRGLQRRTTTEAVPWLLRKLSPWASGRGRAESGLVVVSDRPVLEVRASHGGAQSVSQTVAGLLSATRALELVTWDPHAGCLRRSVSPTSEGQGRRHGEHAGDELVVPWGVPFVVVDRPTVLHARLLAAMAEFTATSVRMVGPDLPPVAGAEDVHWLDAELLGAALELLKHSDRIAAVGESSAKRLSGFCSALTAQGLTGPSIEVCAASTEPLPAERAPSGRRTRAPKSAPPQHGSMVRIQIGGPPGRASDTIAILLAVVELWKGGAEFQLVLEPSERPVGPRFAPLVDDLLGQQRIVRPGPRGRWDESVVCFVHPGRFLSPDSDLAEAVRRGVRVIAARSSSTSAVLETVPTARLVDFRAPAGLAAVLGEALRCEQDSEPDADFPGHRSWRAYAEDLGRVLLDG